MEDRFFTPGGGNQKKSRKDNRCGWDIGKEIDSSDRFLYLDYIFRVGPVVTQPGPLRVELRRAFAQTVKDMC